MSDSDKPVQCERHGQGVATFVCRHLRDGVACGYVSADEDPADPCPDAWCDLCEQTLEREGGWTERAVTETGLCVICNACYAESRARNERVPVPFERGVTTASEADVRRIVGHAAARTDERQREVMNKLDLDRYDRWGVDYRAGLFTLSSRGYTGIVAEMQVAGTFSRKSNSWLWSWANEIFEWKIVEDVTRLRTLGEVRGLGILTDQYHADVDETHAWELASLSRYILEWDAVYRAPMDDRYLFVLLRNLRQSS